MSTDAKPSRSVSAPVLASVLVLVAGLAAHGDELIPGQKGAGEILLDGVENRALVQLIAGSQVTFTAKRTKGSNLAPTVAILDDGFNDVGVGPPMLKEKTKTGAIKKWLTPTTGTWFFVVRGRVEGPSGAYSLKTKVKPPPKLPKQAASIDGVAEVDEFVVEAPVGAQLSVKVKASKGEEVVPRIQEILGPDDVPISLALPVKRKTTSKGETIKKAVTTAFGAQRVRIVSEGDKLGAYTIKITAKFPKAPKTIHEFYGPPTVTGTSPPAIQQGTGPVAVTITGTRLDGDALAAVYQGAGLTVNSGPTPNAGGTSAAMTVTAAGGAAVGDRDFMYTTSLGQSTLTDSLEVTDVPPPPPPPDNLAVTEVVPPTGSAAGGERVTVYGTGFLRGAEVRFGGEPAPFAKRISDTVIVCEVPLPAEPANAGAATTSTTASTPVDVIVTNDPGGTPDAETLADGYAYDADLTLFSPIESFPAQGSTGAPSNLKSGVLRLSGPANTATAISGGTTGTHCFWFEAGASFVNQRTIGFGADRRFLVFSRTTGGNLPVNNTGRYILDVATAVKSDAAAPLVPERLSAAGNNDQWFFTLGAIADSTAPGLTSSVPTHMSTGISPTTAVSLTFGEDLDPLSVNTTSVRLRSGATVWPTVLELSSDIRTVTLKPLIELDLNTVYTVDYGPPLADLSGNAIGAQVRTFSTSDGTDVSDPVIDRVRFDDIRADMDGSGSYILGNDSDPVGNPLAPGGNAAYDLFLPRTGWEVRVDFDDVGPAGIDESTFSALASVTVGAIGAGGELAGKFDVSSTRAIWRVGAGEPFTAGDDVTLTVAIDDTAGNSVSTVVTFDVVDINTTSNQGGDLDPFDARRTWILRDDIDAYTTGYSTNGSTQSVTTTAGANGTIDLDEALRINGLNTASMTAAAAAATNGASTGTNAIVRRLFMERLRAITRVRFGIAEDGTHDADDPNVELLLIGEQGSLASAPTLSTVESSNSAKAFSEMDIGGDTGPNGAGTSFFGTVGTAFTDIRDQREEANINGAAAAGNNTGVFCINMFKATMNVSTTLTSWGVRVTGKFQTAKGGAPVGEHSLDDNVLAGSFNRAAGGNTQQENDRYDDIYDAIEASAMSVSGVLAHEMGHGVGTTANGSPKTGSFGWAHRNNTFTEATSGSPNTGRHIDYLGNDIMAPASSVDDRISTGTDFQSFNPYDDGYLRHRQVYDEGQ